MESFCFVKGLIRHWALNGLVGKTPSGFTEEKEIKQQLSSKTRHQMSCALQTLWSMLGDFVLYSIIFILYSQVTKAVSVSVWPAKLTFQFMVCCSFIFDGEKKKKKKGCRELDVCFLMSRLSQSRERPWECLCVHCTGQRGARSQGWAFPSLFDALRAWILPSVQISAL